MAETKYYSSLSGDEIEATLLGAVRGDVDQNQTTSWKARARANIGAGESNSTFKILGYFDTLEDLQEWLQQLPQSGDAYGIGTASPYDVYVYDGIHNTWVNNGPIAYSDALIDDNDISIDHVWSSSKTNTEVSAAKSLANAAQTTADAAQTTADGKAPINHASTATTYGVGNGTNYGHVKLSDTPDASQDVGDGVAATPAAVQSAIDATKWTLLWTNPSPDTDFVAQTISIDLTNYETIAIASYDEGNSPGTFLFTKGVGNKVSWSYLRTWTGGGALYQRFFTISDNGVTFEAGRRLELPNYSYNANYNAGSKPYKIYGIHL